MTEKRFEYNHLDGFQAYIYDVEDNHMIDDLKIICELLNDLNEENEQLKNENQRMTDKLNELALEFLNYDMVSMGKATEISEMCYYDFLKYRKDNGNTMELQL